MTKWAMRLRVRCAKSLGTEDSTLEFEFEGRKCRLSGSPVDEPLSGSKWWIIRSTDFDSNRDAEAFGIKLGRALRLAGITRENGLDFGKDRASGGFGKIVHDAVAERGGRILPNVHGLLVFEDIGNELFGNFEATATVRENPTSFFDALKNAAAHNLDWNDQLAAAVDLVSRSKIAVEPLTLAALSISALEHLGSEAPWTERQLALFTSLQCIAKKDDTLAAEDLEEVVQSLGQNFRSIRQKVLAKLKELGFRKDDLKEFDRIYGLRSGIFHGSDLDPDSYQTLANDARSFTTKVVIAAVKASSSQVSRNADQ